MCLYQSLVTFTLPILDLLTVSVYVPNNPIPNLEPRHALTNRMDGSGYVAPKYRGVLLHEDAEILHVAVERVDGNGGVLDHDLAGAGGGERGRSDAQWRAGGVEEGGGVGHG